MPRPDVEAAHERTPFLGAEIPQAAESKGTRGFFYSVLDFFGGGIYAPDSSTYEPIEILLNTRDPHERDRLTERWRDNRLSELSFVGVVAALLAGVLTSTGSWPNILPEDKTKPWSVRTSWYCGIILALFSILTAADQTVRLHRLSSHRDGWKRIRNLLAQKNQSIRGNPGDRKKIKPHTLQIYTWQLPVIFLTSATICMIVGMFLHVWAATRFPVRDNWWNSETKTALTFTLVALLSIIIFFAGQATLHSTNEDPLEETQDC